MMSSQRLVHSHSEIKGIAKDIDNVKDNEIAAQEEEQKTYKRGTNGSGDDTT